jgi:hypothetical protein
MQHHEDPIGTSPELIRFTVLASQVTDAFMALPPESWAKLGYRDLDETGTVDVTLYHGPGQDFQLVWNPSSDKATYRVGVREEPREMSLREAIDEATDRLNEIAASYGNAPQR